MSNKYICVIFLVNLSDRLILSLAPDRTTISPSEAAAEYHRRIRLIEAGHNFSDSIPDVLVDSVSKLDDIFTIAKDKLVPDTTTIDPRFATKIKRPMGYHRQLLLNKTEKKMKTTTRWTPYPNYDSAEERSLQRECPRRINHIIRLKRKHEMKNKKVSYSEESVPSSCECHAGNWSESYDVWEKWKQKQCKPGFLNYEHGLELDGTRFRKGHEPEWYKQSKAHSESEEVLSKESRKKNRLQKKYNKKNYVEPQVEGQQPIGYPQQQMGYPPQPMGYPQQQMGYPQQQMGYPQQQIGYPQQQMGYPQQKMSYHQPPMGNPPQQMVYHPHQMGYPPMYYPQYYPPHQPVDHLAYEKLEELHKEIKELKEGTTASLWEQYLKLKKKFETTQSKC